MILSFEKETNGLWYVVLPEYPGEHGDLQMVSGADTMLEMLSEGKTIVTLDIREEPFDGAIIAETDGPDIGDYVIKEIDFTFWLCPVCEWVFGYYPKTIYFKEHETIFHPLQQAGDTAPGADNNISTSQ